MIIKNISVFNTSQKKFEVKDVEIRGCFYYYIGEIDDTDDVVIDGSGKYLLPGFLDIHMHIESSMTTAQEYSNELLPRGATTIVSDCHEITNALGIDGLKEYMDSDQNMDIYYAIPSSVPSTNPCLETTRGAVGVKEVKALCQHPKIIALGEIMNFSDIVSEGDSPTKSIIDAFKRHAPGKPIEGHIPRVTGPELARYAHAGIGSDHTHQSVASLIEKTRAGFLIQLQEKSMNEEIFKAIKDYQLEEFICFATDDVMPDDLIEKGSIDHLIRKAISLGYPPEDAVYAATYVPARRMRLFDRGMIAPGKLADGVIVSDLENLVIKDVIKRGRCVSQLKKDRQAVFSHQASHSIHRNKISKEELIIRTQGRQVLVRAIERETDSTFTKERQVLVDVEDGILQWKEADLNLLCVLERYGKNLKPAFGFVVNGFKDTCAMATSWSHDSHNILCMGRDEALMADLINQVIDMQGGMVISDGHHQASLPLTLGGVVSMEPLTIIGEKIRSIRRMMAQFGYQSHNEIMSFCTLALLVTPELKLSDQGYVRVKTQEVLSWRMDL